MFIRLLLAAALAAQDAAEFAEALARRGWTDLAEDVLARAQQSPDAEPGEYAYASARIKALATEHAENAQEHDRLCNQALQALRTFVDTHPQHPRRVDALSDIGLLQRSRAVRLAPTDLEAAEESFDAAQQTFTDLAGQTTETGERRMHARYNHAATLFSRAEALRKVAGRANDMRRILEDMLAALETFVWEYEWYLLSYDASVLMGRAHRILAETSGEAEAKTRWNRCFSHIGRARRLAGNPEYRKNLAVREISSRALLHEMEALMACNDPKTAARLAEDFLRTIPQTLEEDAGKAVQLAQARAYCRDGQTNAGAQLLARLVEKNKDTWIVDAALAAMRENNCIPSLPLAVKAADSLFEQGPDHLLDAIRRYRDILKTCRDPEDAGIASHCRHQIGRSYFHLGRYREAAEAFSQTEDNAETALFKLDALARLARKTGSEDDRKAEDDWRRHVAAAYPAVPGVVRQAALAAEARKRHLEAAGLWEQIVTAGSDSRGEAMFRIGYNLYHAGGKEHRDRALEWFRKHLQSATADAEDAVGAIIYSSRILIADRPQEALEISEDIEKRFPKADPKHVVAILHYRVRALAALNRMDEAEAEMARLKARYQKDRLGLDYYTNALAALARAYEAAGSTRKAAIHYHELITITPEAVGPDQLETAADALCAGDDDSPKEVIMKALELYETALLQETAEKHARSIRARIALCYRKLRQWDRAIAAYEALSDADDGYMREGLADSLAGKARTLSPGADRNTLLARADAIFCDLLAGLRTRQDEHFWRILHKHAEVLGDTDLDRLRSFFHVYDAAGYGPKWDSDQWGYAPKLEALRREVCAATPRTK